MEIRRGTASLVLGILGLTLFPIFGSIAAIVVGRKASPDDGMARAGVVLGWVGIALSVLGCCLGAVAGLVPALSDLGSPLPTQPDVHAEQPAQPVPTRPAPTAPAAPATGPAAPTARGYLGIRCADDGGARVTDIVPGSPAEQAGLRAGDVITRVGDRFVPFCGDLAKEISARPGQTVRLSVLRNGETAEVIVTLGEQ